MSYGPPLLNDNWQYRDNFYPLCPTWLQQGFGEQYMYCLETMRDVLLDKASQASLFHMPGLGDPSQLPYLAYDRQLVQGPAETPSAFAKRLTGAFAAWKLAGSARSVLGQIQAYAQGQQVGVTATLPEMAIVSGGWPVASGSTATLSVSGSTVTIGGLSAGVTSSQVGSTITLSGCAVAANNGTFPIASYSSGSVTFVNVNASVDANSGSISWYVGPNATKWWTQYQGDAIGALPTLQTVSPSNFNWDGKSQHWRAWLVIYLALVTASGGTSPATGATLGPGSLYLTGPQGQHQYGSNVGGVWVPNGTGTPVNHPWVTVTGLTGANPQPGQWLTLSGMSHAANNGTFPVVANVSATSCVIANPNGVASDSGSTWSLGAYPWVGPATVWGASSVAGAPPYVFGQGQTSIPPIQSGQLVGGVWVPPTGGTSLPTVSWGLSCPATTIAAIRSLLKAWKSASTYYESIVIAVDGGTGAAGSAYSPNSTPGSGNPDGSFGGHGKLVGGVWVPNRVISSNFDAYCQGTGSWNNCSVPNVN
jgi:hypothetical protein